MIVTIPAAIAVAWVTSFVFTPRLAKRLSINGMTGFDLHKRTRPICAEMGGLAIISASAVAFLVVYILDSRLVLSVAPALITIGLVALVGALDDLICLKQRYKPILVIGASIPLVLSYHGNESMWFPLLGHLDFGVLYSLLVIPLMITTFSNFTNMHAGFNGLEAGCASIGLGALGISCLIVGQDAAGLIALILSACYAGFLPYNWFPAKIFPGDIGTLTAGGAIAVVGIIAKLEYVAILVSIPAAFDFTLKMLDRRPFSQRSIYGDSTVTKEGILVPAVYPSLSHAFLRVSRLGEKSLVKVLLRMEALYSAMALCIVILVQLGLLG